MTDDGLKANVIADFRDWHERRERKKAPLANYALDRCEEAFRRCEWERFGYWFTLYRSQRPTAEGPSARYGE